ncbi:MAG: tetratricopeptide repeat protein [Planctomycetes bacterium]|nr:tetratricopeptide repeat protein [Planctomycetota bacterium]
MNAFAARLRPIALTGCLVTLLVGLAASASAAEPARAADPVGDTIKEARKLNRQGDNQAAIKLLRETIEEWQVKTESDAKNADAFYQLARLQTEFSHDEDALAAVDRAIELAPKKAAYVRLRSQLLGYMDRPQDALAAMRDAVELAPKNLNFKDELANLLLDAERYEEAEKLCREVLAAEADREKTTIALVVALRHLDRAREALAPIEALCEKEPDSFQGHVMRALVLEDNGDLPKAFEAYETALKLDRQAQVVVSRLVVLSEVLRRPAECDKYRAIMRAWHDEEKIRDHYFARDEFSLGNQYSVMAYEYYELSGDQALRYWFDIADLENDTAFRISLGSYALTNEMARSTGMIKEGERLYHLDLYRGRRHETYGMFVGEPSYGQTHKLVIGVLDGTLKPWSASERAVKPGDGATIEMPNVEKAPAADKPKAEPTPEGKRISASPQAPAEAKSKDAPKTEKPDPNDD